MYVRQLAALLRCKTLARFTIAALVRPPEFSFPRNQLSLLWFGPVRSPCQHELRCALKLFVLLGRDFCSNASASSIQNNCFFGKTGAAVEEIDDTARKIADVIQAGNWDLDTENALRGIAPLSSAIVHKVISLDIGEESAFRFFSWAARQEGYEHDRDIIRQVACVWAGKYGPEKLSGLLRSIIASRSKFDEAVWAVMIVANTLLQRPNDAVNVFMEMKRSGCKPTSLSYEPLIFLLVKVNRCDAALLTAQEMLSSNIFPEHKALGALFEGLCKSGRSDAALDFVHEVGRLGQVDYHEYAYSRFITAVWRTGRPGLGVELLNEMKSKGLKPDRHAYTVCIKVLCKSYRFGEARSLLNDMYRQNCEPDVMTYNSLINGLSNAGKIQDALSVLELMKEKQCPVDSKIHTAIVKCFFAAGRVDDAIEAFNTMLKSGWTPDMVTYFVMVKNLSEMDKIDLAVDIKRSMVAAGYQPDSRLYLALARGLSRTGQMKELMDLISEMRAKGLVPNAEIYNSVLTHLCTHGDFDAARTWVKEMISKGHKPTPYVTTKFSNMLGDALLSW